MKTPLLYIAAAMMAVSTLTACNGDFELPPMVFPQATMQANTTIAELKQLYYDPEGFSYAKEIGTTADGAHMIIKGRVISSDQTGNIFKMIFIEDETGAIEVNIDAYDLYTSYQYGQEIVLDVTGLYCGAYGRLMQVGSAPSSSYPGRIPSATMTERCEPDGLADPSKIEIYHVTLADLAKYTPGTEGWFDAQSRLVSIEGVSFDDAGKATLSTAGSSGVSRTVRDAEGNTVILYTSGYSDEEMYSMVCPLGTGTVQGILSFYNAAWQIKLLNVDGLIGFTPAEGLETPPAPTPGEAKGTGTAADPYNATKATDVAVANGSASDQKVYVGGYVISGEISEQYMSGTWTIADNPDGTGGQFYLYGIYDFGNNRFTDRNKVKVGDYVVCYGPIYNYNNKTPEMSKGQLYSINGSTGEGGGETPETPSGALYSEAFNNTQGAFTIKNVTLPEELTYVWSATENYGMKASAYNKASYAAESWLISPVFDLAQATDVAMSWDQANNKYQAAADILTQATVWVKAEGADWQQIAADAITFGNNSSWDFVNSGSISLAAYAGKKIQIAFKYTSTTAGAGTWEIKNFAITGGGTLTVETPAAN